MRDVIGQDRDAAELEAIEAQEWLDSLKDVLENGGPERVKSLLHALLMHAHHAGVPWFFSAHTPYINTIPVEQQSPLPGSREMERRIANLVRWNAMMLVEYANRTDCDLGNQVDTFAAAATLYEVGFNHFFRGKGSKRRGDQVYFQGHATPVIYARAYLEHRIDAEQLRNFGHELQPGNGLSSYPHPRLMPGFWEFPTASPGLAPLMAISQARFNRYLEDRRLLAPESNAKIWVFLDDSETDVPEALGTIGLAIQEQLDNLIFVINCDLQHLSASASSQGKRIQALEARFRAAGWYVIKVIWSEDWEPLLALDVEGVLARRMGEVVDAEFRTYARKNGVYMREHFFGADPALRVMVSHLSDAELCQMRWGGQDPRKVYAAYKAAVQHRGTPVVILAQTLTADDPSTDDQRRDATPERRAFDVGDAWQKRARFGVPLSGSDAADAPFYRPPPESLESQYVQERRRNLGGYLPYRNVMCPPLETQRRLKAAFEALYQGSNGQPVSTSAAYVHLLSQLLRDNAIGRLVVPIISDEACGHGMVGLRRRYGVYSHADPQAKNGQILAEGITKAGAMASFIAAGSAYATHGVNTIPFMTFTAMSGFQRLGELIWAAADMRCHGFLIGVVSDRITPAGKGPRRQVSHRHVLTLPVPNLLSYAPAFAYELAVIVQDGLYRMYEVQEDIFYDVTVTTQNYPMPPMPPGHEVKTGILKGMYRYKATNHPQASRRAQLFGSGAMLYEALEAQQLLADRYDVAADVWSITSYKALYQDGIDSDRWNHLHPSEPARIPYLSACLRQAPGVFMVAPDDTRVLPNAVARWFPKAPVLLGTDGFGHSDERNTWRHVFEVDARFMTFVVLGALMREGQLTADVLRRARRELEIDPDTIWPDRFNTALTGDTTLLRRL
jgi:pyruvate dehydrogenase E1 component